MTLESLLGRLADAGIQLSAEGDALHIHAPRGSLAPELTEAVRVHKAALLSRLSLPLSHPQRRLFFLERFHPGAPLYNVAIAFRIGSRAALDETALEAAITDVVARHELLRATFVEVDGRPVMRIAPSVPVVLHREPVDLAPDDALVARAQTFARQHFDLGTAPLVRAALLAERVLVIAVHHLVFDAWSASIFASDLATAYQARVSGSAPDFAPLPSRYGDFTTEQLRRHADGAFTPALERIRHRLAGAVTPLELPIDRPRPRLFTTPGKTHAFTIPASVARPLRKFGQDERATSYMTLLAVFGLLLHRATLAEHFVVGTPTSGRRRREHESVVGLFADLAAVVVDARDRPTFRELLGRVRDDVVATLADADVPFDLVLEALKAPRDPSRPTLVHVAFAYQNAPRPSLSFGDLDLIPIELDPGTSRFDLLLSASEDADGNISAGFEYRTDLFTAETIARLASILVTLAEAAVSDPNVPIDELPLAPPAELSLEPRDEAAVSPVVRSFEAHAMRAPDAPAVTFGSTTTTYAQLDALANRLASWIGAAGAIDRVAVCIEPSTELVATLIALAKLGVAAVPLDSEHPGPRLQALATSAAVSAIVASAGTRDRFEGAPAHILVVDESGSSIDTSPRRVSGASADDTPAYIMFTSGSTGTPKGVVVSQANVARLFEAAKAFFEFRTDDTWTLLHSVAFDFSVWELWGALAHGGRLVVVPRAVARAADSLWTLCVQERVTVLSQTPSAFRALAATALRAERSALRAVVFGGEALDVAMLGPWFTHFGDASPRVFNMYGITEITVHASWTVIDRTSVMLGRSSPIGVAWPDSQLHVVDAKGRRVPAGFPGELWIEGPGVALGYFQDEARTHARFTEGRHARTYKSGDLARVVGGRHYFIGRADDQVKLRGHRIELGEIEHVLRGFGAVAQAAVVLRREPPFADALVAYVVLRDATPDSERQAHLDSLRVFARGALPAFMVPSAFVVMDALPTTDNGKLDRVRLPAPAIPVADAAEQPTSALMAAIASVWCKVLGVPTVPLHESFFDLGGSSLRLAEVQSLLERELGVVVPLVELFEFPTVATLAAHLETPTVGAATPSPTQRRRSDSASVDVAVIGMAVRFPGAPDLDAYWHLLRDGRSASRELSDEELARAGVSESLRRDPRYVRRANTLADVHAFDAAFFGYSPAEAALLDPQQRLFLECVWHALEHAGIGPKNRARPPIGLFAGASMSRHMLEHLDRYAELQRTHGDLTLLLANDKDYVATRVAYELDLRGPVMSVQTACSTSLVAIHEAASALLRHECDVAIAGGVSVETRPPQGYLYREGGIASPDGFCRAFDDEARGTAPGSGVGAVVLKRLSDALADGDAIWATLRGSAVNNDGHDKVGFTAPSVSGQARVIASALAAAGVSARSIGLVEGHGTATALGDPIEIGALTRAFRGSTSDEAFAWLGSVKSNFGHLDAAAGVAGFVKAVLALHHQFVPATLHVSRPTRALAGTPFRLATRGTPWTTDGDAPRRAAVSSFGLGGTNAHVILEEAPPGAVRPSRAPTLTTFARTTHRLPAHAPRPRRSEADFIEALAWRRTMLGPTPDDVAIALFLDTRGLGRALEREFAADEPGRLVRSFAELPDDDDALDRLIDALRARSPHVRLVSLRPLDGDADTSIESARGPCLVEPLRLARAWARHPDAAPLDLVLVTRHAARVFGDEPFAPAKSLVRGAVLTLPLEIAGARVSTIDVASDEADLEVVRALAHELGGESREARMALRRGQRWVPSREPLPHERTPVEGRVAWITGGLGDLGSRFGEALAQAGLSLVLFGRTPMPPVSEWMAWSRSEHGPRAESVRRLLAAGLDASRLDYVTCDVGDHAALAAALAHPFGKPDVAIHAAGAGSGALAVRKTNADLDVALGRARGLLSLCRALEGHPLRALVACSALSAHVGAVGQVDVIAASAVVVGWIDGEGSRRGGRAIARAWPAWQESAMASRLGGRFGVSDREGVDAFLRLLSAPAPCVLVSPEPLEELRALVRLTPRDALEHLHHARVRPGQSQDADSRALDLDEHVAATFRLVLGTTEVSPDRDFFDLGGDSMLALAAVAELETRLGRAVPPAVLVTGGSVRSVANALRGESPSGQDLVVFQEGTPPSVVLAHATSGTLAPYRELVLALRTPRDTGERAIYGLSSPLLREARPEPRAIRDLARDHVRLLLERAPRGPYVMVGWSFGALVAFEAACLLAERGECVAVVVVDMALRSIASPALPTTPLPAVEAAHLHALASYRPREGRADFPLTLIKARSGPFGALGHEGWGWTEVVTTPPRIVTAEGDHESVLSAANVATVADAITSAREGLLR